LSTPSETAIVTSLFGWSPAPASIHYRSSSASVSRSGSVAPAMSPFSRSRSATPISGTRPSTPVPTDPSSSDRLLIPPVFTPRDASLLHCALCQRRVGLWTFAPPPQAVSDPARPQRPFDLMKEHRAHCPYVVRSTVVPSFPVPNAHGGGDASTDAVEGWRAVLIVVGRHGVSQRVRTGERGPSDGSGLEVSDVDGIEAMLAGVKDRGVSCSRCKKREVTDDCLGRARNLSSTSGDF
jgi:hypothetical protein